LENDECERVKQIIAEHLAIDPDKVTEDDNFIDDLGADSLDTVELAMSFEDEFGCEISDEAAESMFTVGDVIKFLETNAKS
jgi:acyl carrier protein